MRPLLKRRITFLYCAHMSGDEKLLILIIGKSKKPRSFPKDLSILPVRYRKSPLTHPSHISSPCCLYIYISLSVFSYLCLNTLSFSFFIYQGNQENPDYREKKSSPQISSLKLYILIVHVLVCYICLTGS